MTVGDESEGTGERRALHGRRAAAARAALVVLAIAWGCDGRKPAAARHPRGDPQRARDAEPAFSDAGLPAGEVILRPPGREDVRVRVEFAVEPETQRLGLMHRERLDADAGMLFVFPLPQRRHTFWMRNTLIPLDMIFIDDGFQVVGVVERAEPLTDTSRRVAAPSRYVLEVNGGFAEEHGIVAGTRVEVIGFDPDR